HPAGLPRRGAGRRRPGAALHIPRRSGARGRLGVAAGAGQGSRRAQGRLAEQRPRGAHRQLTLVAGRAAGLQRWAAPPRPPPTMDPLLLAGLAAGLAVVVLLLLLGTRAKLASIEERLTDLSHAAAAREADEGEGKESMEGLRKLVAMMAAGKSVDA